MDDVISLNSPPSNRGWLLVQSQGHAGFQHWISHYYRPISNYHAHLLSKCWLFSWTLLLFGFFILWNLAIPWLFFCCCRHRIYMGGWNNSWCINCSLRMTSWWCEGFQTAIESVWPSISWLWSRWPHYSSTGVVIEFLENIWTEWDPFFLFINFSYLFIWSSPQ